ncbi:MAG: Fe-S cluster assembly protein SufD [Gammaproteobacteria bacterium]|nr:Fe-S cluster assembly protein SufD [Gammaproteobacteria bacterium]
MNAVTPINDHYQAQFQAARQQLPGEGVAWLRQVRERAFESFRRSGFPGARHEDWKYTNIRPIERHAFRLAAQTCVGLVEDDLGDALLAHLDTHRLVFVNGRYTPQLSKPGRLPEGVSLSSIAETINETPQLLESFLARYADPAANGFSALNTAFMGDGALIRLQSGAVVDKPIHLLYVSTAQGEPTVFHNRNLLLAGQGSQATVIEGYVSLGDSTYLNNAITEILLEDQASIEHYKLQQESLKAYHVATLQVQQARDSRFTSHSISIGGALVRNDINSVLNAEGAECHLNGLYIVNGRQHVDYHTLVDHRQPHGISREFYKGVLAGRSRAVFNGQVYVHQDAQKTDAVQSNKNLLLSPDAEVDTKPQLEIYADDVKCSHGATVGQLDEQMLFYLRSRGIEEDLARGMLTYGFAHDIVERMGIAPLRSRVEDILLKKLPQRPSVKEAQ